MLNRVMIICGVVFMMFLGMLAYHEGDREHSAQIKQETMLIEQTMFMH